MELCSDDEDSRRSNSNNMRPGGRVSVNNPLLPPHLESWYIAVRKSNGGSCIFPSWKDYITNVSSLFDARRNKNSDISSGTSEDVTELAAFPDFSQAIDYINQKNASSHSSVSSPSSSIDSIAKTIITTNSSHEYCGRSSGRNKNSIIQDSQSRSPYQQSHSNSNSKINAIPDAVNSILNASFSNQSACVDIGTNNKSQSQSQFQSQSPNKNITSITDVNKIIDDAYKDTAVTTTRIADIANEWTGNSNKRHYYSFSSTTSDHDTTSTGKRIRRETSLTKTADNNHNTSSLDALATTAAEHKYRSY